MLKYKVSIAYDNQEQSEFFDSPNEAKFFLDIMKTMILLDEFQSFDFSLIHQVEYNTYRIGSTFISLEEVEVKLQLYSIIWAGEELISGLSEEEANSYVSQILCTIKEQLTIEPSTK